MPRGRGGGRRDGPPQRFGYMGRGGRGPPPRRGDYRVTVSGLPSTGSWQDLKDHMREAGDVTFTDVFRDGTGVVEFSRRSDMEFALRNLDDTKFRSHEVGPTTIVTLVDVFVCLLCKLTKCLSRADRKAGLEEQAVTEKSKNIFRCEQDSNLRRETLLDYKSNALTTRPSQLR